MAGEIRNAYRLPLDLAVGRQATFYPIGFLGRVTRQYEGAVYNISRDGLSAKVSAKARKRQKFWVLFAMGGPLKGLRLRAKVVTAEKDGGETGVGLRFMNPPPEAMFAIDQLVKDYKACEGAIAFAIKDVCKRGCAYWDLCRKPVKKTL